MQKHSLLLLSREIFSIHCKCKSLDRKLFPRSRLFLCLHVTGIGEFFIHTRFSYGKASDIFYGFIRSVI